MLKNIKKFRLWVLALPFLIFGLGVFSNVLVISVNHGMMPVMVPTAYMSKVCNTQSPFDQLFETRPIAQVTCAPGTVMDDAHVVYDPDHTNLVILTDWIIIPHDGAYSPGDIALALGNWLTFPCLFAWLGVALLGKTD